MSPLSPLSPEGPSGPVGPFEPAKEEREDDFILDIIAYPNPTYDKVMFEGGDPVGIYHIRVVDKLGRVLEQKTMPFQEFVLEMGRYNNGTYLIEVVEDKTGKRKIFNIVKSQN